MPSLPVPALLLITDRSQTPGVLMETVSDAVAAGVRWVGVREKDLAPEDQIALVRQIKALPDAPLVSLFGPAALARKAGADGVHLDRYGAAEAVRRHFGDRFLIGKSCHDEWEVQEAKGADYVTLSPVYESASKPGYGAMGTKRFKELAEYAEMPALGLGGIAEERIGEVVGLGGAGVAVMGEVMRSPDPGGTARRLIDALSRIKSV
ncbi:MAG: thiamine phosphate synthase [Alphaproteobacteria bacterium]|nr:thiamine phosphate synthase [Alphaproteobacteria bacterium]